jgi:hypothetical protein
VNDLVDWLTQSGGGVATVFLALSGLVFVVYVLTIVGIIAWQKVSGR